MNYVLEVVILIVTKILLLSVELKKKTHDFVDRKHGASVLKPVVFRIFLT